MRTLLQLVRYNAWANQRMLDLCQTVTPALLQEIAEGTTGSVEQTLKHLVAVEDAYLAMLQGRDPSAAAAGGSYEAYLAQDLAWFTRRSGEIAEGYRALLSGRDESWLDGAMHVPWFDFAMTNHDGLLQALTHSGQHRAQVLSALGARRVTVPDVDYVFMLGEESGDRPQPRR